MGPDFVLTPALQPPSPLVSYPSGPAFGKNHYYVLILCLWVSERRMAASG